MDKTQFKLAMEFFRSEIKRLAKRLITNKQALRSNQRSASKGLPGNAYTYDKSGEKYWWCAEVAILNDKKSITAMHIIYGELRGKPHVKEEKKKEYDEFIMHTRKRMEEYIKQKQDTLISEGAISTGGI